MIEIKEILTDNKDLEYIKECAESVGMDVTDKTTFSISFIAEVMRKMKEQSIFIPKGATNGEVFEKLMHEAYPETLTIYGRNDDTKTIASIFSEDWWNSPYRKEQE